MQSSQTSALALLRQRTRWSSSVIILVRSLMATMSFHDICRTLAYDESPSRRSSKANRRIPIVVPRRQLTGYRRRRYHRLRQCKILSRINDHDAHSVFRPSKLPLAALRAHDIDVEDEGVSTATLFHKNSCVFMSLEGIRTDIAKTGHPRPFSLERCPHCSALRDKSEKELCCMRGKHVISDEQFPPWPDEYVRVLGAIDSVSEKSRELNNLCNFSTIGTSHALEDQSRTGFLYRERPVSRVCMH